MHIKMDKAILKKAVERATLISSQGIREGLEYTNRFRIKSEANKVEFSTTNGHLDFRWVVDPIKDSSLEVISEGEAVIDSLTSMKIINSLGGKNKDVQITIKSERDRIEYSSPKSKSSGSVPKLQQCKDVDISKPRHPILTHNFEANDFVHSLDVVVPYGDPSSRKPRFQMILLHFCKEEGKSEIRFVAGNGSFFAVYMTATTAFEEELKVYIPIEQAKILIRIIDPDSKNVLISYKDLETCYIETDDGMEMMIRGIAKDPYILYNKHACRINEAKVIIDVSTEDWVNGCNLIGAVEDKEIIKEGSFHSSLFIAESDELRLDVDERKFKAKYTCPANIYKITQNSFKSHYSFDFLSNISQGIQTEWIRFYGIDEDKIIIVEPFNYAGVEKDTRNIPVMKPIENEKKLLFFFSAVKGKEDSQ